MVSIEAESPAHILPVAAESYGDKVALITDNARLSFTDLEARSNQLANALVEMRTRHKTRNREHWAKC